MYSIRFTQIQFQSRQDYSRVRSISKRMTLLLCQQHGMVWPKVKTSFG